MIQDLRIGAPVAASDGKYVGRLARVVVDGTSDRVLSLVVDPGLIESGNLLAPGGWERPRERVIPIDQVADARPERVTLRLAESDFANLPLFEHEQYVAADPAGDSLAHNATLQASAVLNEAASVFGFGGAPVLPASEITHEEPTTAGAIAAGSQVWRLEPHERIGEVERVLVDEATQRVTGFVVRHGLLRHLVVLPIDVVTGVEDDVVHVRIGDEELKALAPFEPAE